MTKAVRRLNIPCVHSLSAVGVGIVHFDVPEHVTFSKAGTGHVLLPIFSTACLRVPISRRGSPRSG